LTRAISLEKGLAASTSDNDERSQIEAAQADPARFVDLYERHFHQVYAFVSRRAGNRAAAEDITSEVFEQALANLRRYTWRGIPFVAWLLRIASNALADRWRQMARDSYDPPPEVPDRLESDDIELRAILVRWRRRRALRGGGRRRCEAALATRGSAVRGPRGPRRRPDGQRMVHRAARLILRARSLVSTQLFSYQLSALASTERADS
jgi:RNA polymerase sigma factor (sigma-70 family)